VRRVRIWDAADWEPRYTITGIAGYYARTASGHAAEPCWRGYRRALATSFATVQANPRRRHRLSTPELHASNWLASADSRELRSDAYFDQCMIANASRHSGSRHVRPGEVRLLDPTVTD
jgi:hypothetical protein